MTTSENVVFLRNRLRQIVAAIRLKVMGSIARKPALRSTPEIGGHRFLFISGLHRSGTSILHRLIRGHPDCTAFSKSGVPEDEGQHLQSVVPAASAFGGPGVFAFDARCNLDENSDLVTAINRDKLLREWCAYYNLAKKTLLEKSPTTIVRARFFQALFPGCRFIFIVRHPIAVSLATRKWSRTSLEDLIDHWITAHTIMLRDMAHLENKIVVRYEDLVASPQPILNKIYSFAGLTPIPASEQLRDHNAAYYVAWNTTDVDSAAHIRRHRPEFGHFAERFGYQLTAPFVEPIASTTFEI